MPFLPPDVANQITIAGQGQINTGNKLKSSASRLKAANIDLNDDGQIVETIRALQTGVDNMRPILSSISLTLSSIARLLRGISIPALDITRRNIFGIRVITGVQITNLRPFNNTATQFDNISSNVDNIRVALLEVSSSLGDLNNSIPNIRQNINNSANDMDEAGDHLILSGNAIVNTATL